MTRVLRRDADDDDGRARRNMVRRRALIRARDDDRDGRVMSRY